MNGGEPGRRKFLKLCAATGALVAARPELLGRQARASTPLPASRLVDTGGRPLDPDSLEVGESYVFHYPFVTTPCFLINLGKPVGPVDGLKTEDGQQYRWPGGAGPRRSVVAFSAICAHKMSYPTKTVSFINYRSDPVKFVDGGRQPAQREHVIYCCSEKSVYDPEDGARVLGGPAPQPLVALAWGSASTRRTRWPRAHSPRRRSTRRSRLSFFSTNMTRWSMLSATAVNAPRKTPSTIA